MKRLLLFLLLPLAPLHAIYYCCPNWCFDPCCTWTGGHLQLSVEAFYANPRLCSLDFVIQDPRPFDVNTTADFLPQLKSTSINNNYGWAPRVIATYVVPGGCVDFSGIYTGFHNSTHQTIFSQGSGGLWPTHVNPLYMSATPIFSGTFNANPLTAFAKGRSRFDMDSGELQFAVRSAIGNRVCTRAYGAVHVMELRQYFDTSYFGLTNPGQVGQALLFSEVENKAKVWGVGPKVGIDAHFDLWCGFGISGKMGLSVLAGRAQSWKFERDRIQPEGSTEPTIDETLAIDTMKFGRIFPYLEGRLGLDYRFCWCASLWFLEVGYQYLSYINLFNETTFNDQRGTSDSRCTSFNLDGLYIRLTLQI